MVKTVLSGHISESTAYRVADYPYGFRIRCQIRYWVEHHPKKGARYWSQTSNPKRPGLVWNKPKASIYSLIAGALYLDENDHVQFSGLTEYSSAAEAIAWRDTFGSGILPETTPRLNHWIERKQAFEVWETAREVEV